MGFCPPSIRVVWWGFNADEVLAKLFFGGKDLAKPRLIFVFAFCPRGGGVWGGPEVEQGSLRGKNPRGLLFLGVDGEKCYNTYKIMYLRNFNQNPARARERE